MRADGIDGIARYPERIARYSEIVANGRSMGSSKSDGVEAGCLLRAVDAHATLCPKRPTAVTAKHVQGSAKLSRSGSGLCLEYGQTD
jgi:hypothetical protein